MKQTLIVLLGLLVWASPANSQEVAKSRAEIANQRIAAEVETRRRAEEAALKNKPESQVETSSPAETPASSPAPKPVSTSGETAPARSRASLSLTMQQIRTLGELRDAGYVTEEEFDRIKRRILDGEL